MIPDFQNWSLEKCGEVIQAYRTSRDPKMFHLLLARFDRYILFTINNYKRQFRYLMNEDPQELYHIGVLGVHRCFISLNKTGSTRYLLLRIKSYVIEEIKRRYKHRLKEKESSINLEEINEEEKGEFQDKAIEVHSSYLDVLSAKLLLESVYLTDHERELLRLKYYEGLTFKQVAKRVGLAYSTVHIHITRAIRKLRKHVGKGELR